MASVRLHENLNVGGTVSKESAYSAGDSGSIPGLGRSPAVLLPGESPGDRKAWQATVHRVTNRRPYGCHLSSAHTICQTALATEPTAKTLKRGKTLKTEIIF